MNGIKRTAIIGTIGLLALPIVAGNADSAPMIYPSKGHDQAQQNKDEGECHQWAIQKSGVDPAQLAAQTNSGEIYERHRTALGSTARGALAGLAIVQLPVMLAEALLFAQQQVESAAV